MYANINQSWPDCYYLEEKKDERRVLLLSNMGNSQNSENDIRLSLWDLRYAPRKGSTSNNIDYFVKGFVELLMESKMSINIFNSKAEKKHMKRIMEDLGIISSPLFLSDSYADKELVNSLLYEEYVSFASYYIHFSSKDSHYSSGLMGSIHLNEEQIIEKLAQDFKHACLVAPKMFDLTDSFSIFRKGCFDAFQREYPQQGVILSKEK